MIKIIPAIDLQNGQCVRLQQGKFTRSTRYSDSPLATIDNFRQSGAKQVHIVDLDGAKEGNLQQLSLIKSLLHSDLSIQVGGGIRTLATAKSCIEAGINQLVIGSIAIHAPDLTKEIIDLLGAQSIILALDVNLQNGIPKLATQGWQHNSEKNLWEVVDEYQRHGINNILCTDIACDGMLDGPNFFLYQEAIQKFPEVNWQASGGIRDLRDVRVLNKLGIHAAIIGRALYENNFNLDFRGESC